jgi:hypothetical protein
MFAIALRKVGFHAHIDRAQRYGETGGSAKFNSAGFLKEPPSIVYQGWWLTVPDLLGWLRPILRFDDALKKKISVSNNWENNLSCPIDRRQSVAPILWTAAASTFGWWAR